MLTEQGFVQKATRRMSGDGTEMDEMVDSTVGSVRQASWMDNIIDGIFGLFGRDTAAEREEKRLHAYVQMHSKRQLSPNVQLLHQTKMSDTRSMMN